VSLTEILITTAIGTIALILVLAIWSYRYWEQHDHKHGFLYEFTKDFAAPLLLAILGVFLAFEFNSQRDAEAENQRKAAILRDIMTTRDGPDVAFFTAVGDRLMVHLRRYEKFRSFQSAAPMPRNDCQPESDAQKTALFDEKAIYFFYGMYRVARMDFLATKGYVLYPRIWMEEAFSRVTDKIIEDFMGTGEADLCASPVEQAALYHYFGASKATYYTSSKRPGDAFPDLFEFNKMLGDAAQCTGEEEPYWGELRKGFEAFQRRLEKKFPSQEIITSFEAITGLDDYAFNTLFSEWYSPRITRNKQFHSNPPVERLLNTPPEDFLRYPLDTFEFKSNVPAQKKKEWDEERQKAWKTILDNLPDDFKAK
jgi:hypothetical protein